MHGAFVSDQEVHRVVQALKTSTPPNYVEEVLSGPSMPIPGLAGEEGEGGSFAEDAEADPLYDEAVRIVTTERKPSISYVQRRLKIGYNRAARLLEAMETAGTRGAAAVERCARRARAGAGGGVTRKWVRAKCSCCSRSCSRSRSRPRR